jgi:hypothetical protein
MVGSWLRLDEVTEPPPPADWVDSGRRDAARFPLYFCARCVKAS